MTEREYDPGQLDRLVEVVRDVLSDAVLGTYLHGSSVFGSLRPTSDLDVFVVASRRTTREERRALTERFLPMSGSGNPSGRSRHVGLEIVAAGDVRPLRLPAWLDYQYGDWYRPDYARGDWEPWNPRNPDLVILLEMVRQADRPLVGPPAAALLDPVPAPVLRRAMLDAIPDLLADLEGDERNVVLTLARIRATMATGRFLAKDAAADWLRPLLADATDRRVVEHARAIYVGEREERWDGLLDAVRPCAERLVAAIEADARGLEVAASPATGRSPDAVTAPDPAP